MVFDSIRGVVKFKFVKLSSSSCDKWTWKDLTCDQAFLHFFFRGVLQHKDGLSFNFNEDTFRGVL